MVLQIIFVLLISNRCEVRLESYFLMGLHIPVSIKCFESLSTTCSTMVYGTDWPPPYLGLKHNHTPDYKDAATSYNIRKEFLTAYAKGPESASFRTSVPFWT